MRRAPERSPESPRLGQRASFAPGPGVVGGYLAARIVASVLVALPLASSVGAVLAGYPRGDAVLWEPGGVMLLETARLIDPLGAGIAWSSAALLLVGLFALLLPLGALIAALGPAPPVGPRRRPTRRQVIGRAGASWGKLGLAQGIVLLTQAMLLGLFDFIGRLLARSLELGDVGQHIAELAVLAVGLGLAWLLGLAHDVARIAVVQHGRGLVGALEMAVRVLGAGLWRVLWAGAVRTLLAGAMLLTAASVGLAIDPTRSDRAVLVAIFHLCGCAGAVLVRVSWLRWLTDRVALAWGLPAHVMPAPSAWPIELSDGLPNR